MSLLLAILVTAFASASQPPPDSQPTISEPELATGIRQVEQGDLDGAVKTLTAVVRGLFGNQARARELAQAYLYLGVAYALLDEAKPASSYFREAIRSDPQISPDRDKLPPKALSLFDEAARTSRAVPPEAPLLASDAPLVGFLAVTSRPAGARVSLNGRFLGLTDLFPTQVPAGTHQVEVARDGYRPEIRSLTIAPRATETLAVDLVRATASLSFVTEPKSGVEFATERDGMSLLGVGLRALTFLKVKVYAIGLYVADSALTGDLAVHRGGTDSPAFYWTLASGDFPKAVVLRYTREVGRKNIQGAMREGIRTTDTAKLEQFLSYFPDVNAGEECVIRWAPGGTLLTTMAGQAKPPIEGKEFATAVLSMWLGEKPIQEDIKKSLVSRAAQLIN